MANRNYAASGNKAEDRLQQLEAGVKAAQPGHDAAAFLAAIVESSDDAIISKSLQGIITTWNKSAERVFGYTAAEAVGRPITMLIPQDRLDEEPAILARINIALPTIARDLQASESTTSRRSAVGRTAPSLTSP